MFISNIPTYGFHPEITKVRRTSGQNEQIKLNLVQKIFHE